MIKFIIKRLILGLFTIIIVAIIVFFMIHIIPGTPLSSRANLPDNIKQNIINKYGLDKSLNEQISVYFYNILHGDLGLSIRNNGRTVNDIILNHLPISMGIGGMALILSMIVAIPLGVYAATNPKKTTTSLCKISSIIIASIPEFIIAILFQYIFCVKLKWIPTFISNDWTTMILPIVILTLYPGAIIFQLIKNSIAEELKKDYITMLIVSGVPYKKILFKYALRNAYIPLLNYIGPLIVSILTGSFVVEKTFGIPGIGRYFIVSVLDRDYTVILGLTLFFTVLMVFFNLLTDIICKILDPKIDIE